VVNRLAAVGRIGQAGAVEEVDADDLAAGVPEASGARLAAGDRPNRAVLDQPGNHA